MTLATLCLATRAPETPIVWGASSHFRKSISPRSRYQISLTDDLGARRPAERSSMNCLAKPGSLAALAWAALACGLILAGQALAQSGAEYNPVRRPPVSIGPEAHRLIVGFRAFSDAGRTVVARRQGRVGCRKVFSNCR